MSKIQQLIHRSLCLIIVIQSLVPVSQAQSLNTPSQQANQALIYSIDDHDKLRFTSDVFDDFFTGLDGADEEREIQTFDAIRVYQMPQFPQYVYFWSCKNILENQYDKPDDSSNCKPLVYHYKDGKVSFYFDQSYTQSYEEWINLLQSHNLPVHLPRLAAFDVYSLLRAEQNMRQAHRNEQGTILALGITASILGGLFAAEFLIIPMAEAAAASVLAKAVYAGGAYNVTVVGLIASYLGDITVGVYGFAFLVEALTIGTIEHQVRTSFLNNSPSNLGDDFALQGEINKVALQPIKGNIKDYEEGLLKLINGDISYFLSGYYMIHTSMFQKPQDGVKLFELDLHAGGGRTYKQKVAHGQHCRELARQRRCEYLEKHDLPGTGRVFENEEPEE